MSTVIVTSADTFAASASGGYTGSTVFLICGGLVSFGARPLGLPLRARRNGCPDPARARPVRGEQHDHAPQRREKRTHTHASAVRYHDPGMKRYDRFADFYPVYLAMHRHSDQPAAASARQRAGLGALVYAIAARNPWALLAMPVFASGLAFDRSSLFPEKQARRRSLPGLGNNRKLGDDQGRRLRQTEVVSKAQRLVLIRADRVRVVRRCFRLAHRRHRRQLRLAMTVAGCAATGVTLRSNHYRLAVPPDWQVIERRRGRDPDPGPRSGERRRARGGCPPLSLAGERGARQSAGDVLSRLSAMNVVGLASAHSTTPSPAPTGPRSFSCSAGPRAPST